MIIKEILKKIPGLHIAVCWTRAFNAPIQLILKNRKRMKAFAQKHTGKRCFIIGNGPSLTPEDLEKIKGEYSFAANRIYKIFDKTAWRPTYYCVQDMEIAQGMGEELLTGAACAQATFVRMWGYKKIKNLYNERIKDVVLVPIIAMPLEGQSYLFSDNANKYIYDGSTVTYMSMELAVHMGFTEIYLLGVDHSYPFTFDKRGELHVIDESLASHFYTQEEEGRNENIYKGRANQGEVVTAFYQAAEDYSRKTGKFRIFNATRGGKLEVFERVDLDKVLNENGQEKHIHEKGM